MPFVKTPPAISTISLGQARVDQTPMEPSQNEKLYKLKFLNCLG